ncbi:MAG: argininosuccinate lyase [Spirochaetales bacterium]|nr:argininosuccinate lyase [Spirochaetales bacterium]
MSKLWQKDYDLDTLMETFTVGDDYILDQHLVISDALGSIAHARGLQKLGILSEEETADLTQGLVEIIDLRLRDDFPINKSDEDCHTAIEGFLVKRVGEAGKKIHTGRSRNDQVQTALRLWMREFAYKLARKGAMLADALFDFAERHRNVPMPGRTHMQLAMPSSVGLWASSYAEELADESKHLLSVAELLDQSPLGSAASYGVPLDLDREYTSALMGFSRVQNNVLYANDSRGKFEAILLDGCDYLGLTLSKLAQDLMIFTLPELGYFSLPKELTTGSSIMPQKKNPDGLELARSRSSVISSSAFRIKSIIRSLPSGYNRDFQDTKGALFEGAEATWLLLGIFEVMIEGLIVDEEALVKGCRPELYATDLVLKRTLAGESFRDTYREVGLHLSDVVPSDPYEALKERRSVGTAGNLNIDRARTDCVIRASETRLEAIRGSYEGLSGLKGLEVVSW